MNKKLNLVEILKDCLSGTKFYTPVWGEVSFRKLLEGKIYAISIDTCNGNTCLTKEGCYIPVNDAECIIFPSKDQRDWSKFVSPCKFKDGDIIATKDGSQVFILKRVKNDEEGYCYIGYDFIDNALFRAGEWYFSRLATEEEKRKFFDAIKLNGYKWNAETKTLEKLIPNRFNPITLKPFDKVLFRDSKSKEWTCGIFSHISGSLPGFPFRIGSYNFKRCIPYNNDTKHLVGTNEEAPEFYRYWED